MKLSKYAKLVKEGGYCSVVHAEDSGIWLGTRAALFRATELPDMVGEEQVRTVLDIPRRRPGRRCTWRRSGWTACMTSSG